MTTVLFTKLFRDVTLDEVAATTRQIGFAQTRVDLRFVKRRLEASRVLAL